MGIKDPEYETYLAIYLHSHDKNSNGIEVKATISIICDDTILLQRYFQNTFNRGTHFGYEDFFWRDRLEEVECKDNKPLNIECEVSLTLISNFIK